MLSLSLLFVSSTVLKTKNLKNYIEVEKKSYNRRIVSVEVSAL